MKHTNAPWNLLEHEHEPCELIGNGTIKIAEIYCTDFPAGEADARLIVAAPELLAALRRAVPWLGKMIADGAHLNSVLPRDCEMALAQAEAAIAKAGGKPA
jgi:hypothetical protein